jgi:exodeoxyribonuclease-5
MLNHVVRSTLGMPDEPIVGERVICLRNNHTAGIFNGQIGYILRIHKAGKDFRVEIEMAGVERNYVGSISREQFGSRETLSHLRNIDLFDWAYCLTVHKAQGSEAESVILYEQRCPLWSHKRWLYTGITRAKKRLEIIA